jgi:blue copper oxidase
LQDKMFDGTGRMAYEVSAAVFEDGFEGDTLVVNGAVAPVGQTVPQGLVRLRILNACNARFLTLSMETGPMHVIASDGGFLARRVEAESILMSPGERYEVLVDMRAAVANSLMVRFGSWPARAGGADAHRLGAKGDGRGAARRSGDPAAGEPGGGDSDTRLFRLR